MTEKAHALEVFRLKEYEKAYPLFKGILEESPDDPFGFRDLNNILVCIFFSDEKKRDPLWCEEFESYLAEYLEIAKKSDTTTWMNNIIEDLLQYTIEAAFIRFTEDQREFSDQKKDLRDWFDRIIVSFINTLKLPEKRDVQIFYDVILRIIFKERVNFERKGNEYQNIVNTKTLGEFFLDLVAENPAYRRTRSNVHLLFSELVYSDPESESQDYYFLTREAVKHLDQSLAEWPTNQFSKKRREQLMDSLVIQEQLHRFDHDIRSKISTLTSLIQGFKEKTPDFSEPARMERIINDISAISNLSKNEVPKLERVDIPETINEILHESSVEIAFQHQGKPVVRRSNRPYFRLIIENLVKNSAEAYKRRDIARSSPAIVIDADFHEGLITLTDWAGGISEDLLRNNRLFEPYVSEKGVSQSSGLGLSLVKKACDRLGMSIEITVHGASTRVTLTLHKE